MSEIDVDFEQQIDQYLQAHPDYFSRHQALLDQLVIHHQRKGMISLVEAQLGRQREKIATLENALNQVSSTVQQNETLFFSLLPLQKQLYQAKDIIEASHDLDQWAKTLGLKQGKILLLKDAWQSESVTSQYWLDRKAFEIIRLERFGLQSFYLGKLTNREKSLLFLPEELPIGSVAICLLNNKQDHKPYHAVLVFTALHEGHFYRGQNTDFLETLIELIEPLFHQWLTYKK
ncbi:DUF484 family protein [Gallibacterium genomosp. 3]|uniref:DUF484 family protein n=1 Tax=Gallibacterium genomosp. 3 TaxID=505345 RepID=A0A1A7QB87_9PAST|nr:DUF484 family protein [Gallibacterium genomosp. 3]OBW93225.1 hypothetical protein QV01_02465 [Gallibacterium genomosp. 3]OBX11157.1 hypothetical protein QV07_02080 [Gallibacterium genomosp. 3]